VDVLLGRDRDRRPGRRVAALARAALFGGEGLFVTTLTGPGKVVLQSMDLAKIAASIIPFLPRPEPQGK
jgi:uncharacterized protein (AIM24 family)